MRIRFDRRFAVITGLCIGGIFVVSSIPYLTLSGGRAFRTLCNVLHAPVYGVVALLMLRTFKARAPITGTMFAVIFAVSAAFALLDEFHQSFIPGRFASAGDFVTDLAGIGAVLAFNRRRAAPVPR